MRAPRFRTGLLRSSPIAHVLLAIIAGAPAGKIHAAPIAALLFTPDGSALISNGPGKIQVRSPANGAIQKEIECSLRRISAISLHPSGQFLAVGGGDPGVSGEVQVLNWPDGRLFRGFTNFTDIVTSVAFDSSGAILAAASADHSARLWRFAQTPALTPDLVLGGHAAAVLAVAFAPGSDTVVTAGTDRSLKVWSATNGQLIRSLSHHTEAVHALVFQPGRDPATPAFCASAGDDRTVRIWQPGIGRMVRIIRKHEGSIYALAFSPNGRTLLSAGKEGMVRRLDPESDEVLGICCAQEEWIYALAVSPNGSKLATGDWAGNVRVWNLPEK